MGFLNDYTFAFIIALVVTVIATPLVKKLAFKFNVVDKPNEDRKVHKKTMPYLGGLAIALGFFAGYIYLYPKVQFMPAFIIGALLIIITGVVDDKYKMSAKYKLLMQILVAVIVVSSGVSIDFIQVPYIGQISFGWWGYPLSILWIVGVTNAINFIDGLDGLATGVSSIALIAIMVMGILNGQVAAIGLSVILLGGTLGFLFFNIHPAKIFMGDAGSMFIGYTMAVISILGLFKSLTFFSIIIPIIVLAVPIFDTSFAIIRRIATGQKISTPDRLHLHHCLMNMGFSHRTTVFIIYGISATFGIAAIIFSRSVLWGSLIILILSTFMLRFTIELVGTWQKKKPLVEAVKKIAVQGKTKG
jgi:UDP-GlcNAc:undecaprenyl-phosphate/decaprenyl-phosphate GlcNAc-1-phosphate transferase